MANAPRTGMPYIRVADRRAASRRHYDRNSGSMKRRAAVHREEARQRNREFIAQVKTSAPCADCGVSYPPYVMQFDHFGEDKDRAVATLAGAPVSLKRLQTEIDKCELVCANCHAERTYQRRVRLNLADVQPGPVSAGISMTRD